MALLKAASLAAGLAGCGANRQYLSARALPVVVVPADADWSIDATVALKDRIYVQLANQGIEPVSVLWDESVYIDVDQRSHRVLPESEHPMERASRATIAPGTRLDEILVPAGTTSDNPHDPLLPEMRRGRWWWPFGHEKPRRIGSKIRAGDSVVGRQVGVFLVLERNNQKKTVLAKYEMAPAFTR